jgi:uncharacterized protein DUF5134
MAGPSWLAVTLAAVMIVTALYCASRLAASRLRRRATELDADAVHAVMGAAMTGMLLPRLSPVPGSVWQAVFAVAAAWFAWQAIRGRRGHPPGGWRCCHPVPHLVECVAMIYMLVPVPGSWPGGQGQQMPMPGMSQDAGPAGTLPALALVLALFMTGYVLWTADQLTSLARATSATTTRDAARPPARLLVTTGAPAAAGTQGAGAPAASAAPAVHRHPAASPALAPRLAACYQIAMGIAMGYMLITML